MMLSLDAFFEQGIIVLHKVTFFMITDYIVGGPSPLEPHRRNNV